MLKNLSLQVRFVSAFMFIGVIVLIVGIIGWSGAHRLRSHIETFTDNTYPTAIALWKINEAQTRALAGERMLLTSFLNLEDRQRELKEVEKAKQDIKEGWETYEKLPRDADEDKIYKKVMSDWDKWDTASQSYLQLHDRFLRIGVNDPRKLQTDLLKQEKSNTPIFVSAEAAIRALTEMNNFRITTLESTFNASTSSLLELLNYSYGVSTKAQKSANTDISQSSFWILLGLLLGPVTAIAFGIYFSKPLVSKITELVTVGNTISSDSSNPQMHLAVQQDEIGKLQTVFYSIVAKISGVVEVAQKISAGDLTGQILVSGQQDEIGKLQNAFYTMNKDLNTLIRRIQQSGVQITTSATQIAASGKELEATVTEQLASTNEVTATAQEIAATSKNLVKMMEKVGTMTQTTASAANDSRGELQEMENTMRQLTDATTSITSKLGVMNKKASNINNVVVTITKVADQTSILSLNAAIEAEKAGEYGAGFAVVAREIRRLANQTSVATLEIEQIVKDMQSAVTMGVMEMDKFNKSVSDTVEQVSKISYQIGKVINQVQSLPPQFEQVSQSMEEQSEAAEQISEAMEQLSEASHQTVDALRETNSALEQLDDAAKGLRSEVSRFKVQS